MSGRGGGQVHRSDVQGVPIPWCICLAHPPFPCGQTDVYENIIFPQDCLRAVKSVRAGFTSSLKAANFLFPLLLNDQGFTCASNSISLIPRITSTGKSSFNIYALTIDVAVVRIQCAFIYVWNKFYLFQLPVIFTNTLISIPKKSQQCVGQHRLFVKC